jgi:hypothetical protein
MSPKLPELKLSELEATKNYLQDACKVIGQLQLALIPKSPHDWHYGLEVTMRGISTQTLDVNSRPTRVLIDLVRHKLRLGELNWILRENSPAELFSNIQSWCDEQKLDVELRQPEMNSGTVVYDAQQADIYINSLWWIERQFKAVKDKTVEGLTSPILLYPHHFDLSLVWFPLEDERQIAIGFSLGDQDIAEPYIYITLYPEPEAISKIKLPEGAYFQSQGFNGAILLYGVLQKQAAPEKALCEFITDTLKQARTLL